MIKAAVVLLLCLREICWARIADYPEDPLVVAYGDLPESEKNYFLEYYLALGILYEEGEVNQGLHKNTIRFSNGQKNEELLIPDSLNITENLVEKFSAMNIPEKSTIRLLSWIKSEFGLNEENVKELLIKGKYCLPPCYDMGDLGPLCCPW